MNYVGYVAGDGGGTTNCFYVTNVFLLRRFKVSF